MRLYALILCLLLCGQAIAGEWVDTVETATYIYSLSTKANINYGSSTALRCAADHPSLSDDFKKILIKPDLSGFSGSASNTDSSILELYASELYEVGGCDDSISLKLVLKYWIEGVEDGTCPYSPDTGTVWNKRKCMDAGGPCGCVPVGSTWTATGCAGLNGDYSESGAVKGNGAQDAWMRFDVTEIIKIWLRGDTTNFGVLLWLDLDPTSTYYKQVAFISDDYSTASYRPRWHIWTTDAAEEETKGVFRNNLSGKSGEFEKHR